MPKASDIRRAPAKVRAKPKPRSREEKIGALEVVAQIGFRQAAKELGVGKRQLEDWRNEFPKEYSDFRAGRNEEYRKAFAAKLEDLAEHYTDAEELAVQRAIDALESGDTDPKELAALIKAMGSSRGNAVLNARQSRGEPDKSFDLNINFPQIEQAAEAILSRAEVVDSTAEELTP